MSAASVGSRERPLRVAVVGAGPAGFYAADALLRHQELTVEVDMFDRLPAPFGLVRSGVAPDHQRIKRAAKAFERTAASPGYRFVGNVTVGRDVSVEELSAAYDQLIFTTGSATDRSLNIPGEDLQGSHSATEFVGWYNAHPDFYSLKFDLSVERVVVVGVGNVAMDVARILVRSTDELAKTDIAGYALDALRQSAVREVVLLGRRGPAEAAFDARELQDIAELSGVRVEIGAEQLDPVLAEAERFDAPTRRKLGVMKQIVDTPPADEQRVVRVVFLASPVELMGEGRVQRVRIEHNELVADDSGRTRPRGTGRFDELEAGMVLRSVGYRGVPVPGVPFDDRRGLIPNIEGRVTLGADGAPIPGLYVAGWIKRGPTGLIGTNKGDAQETVARMLEDVPELPARELPPRDAVLAGLVERGVKVASYSQWQIIDKLEIAAGERVGKIREKFASVEQMLEALQQAEGAK